MTKKNTHNGEPSPSAHEHADKARKVFRGFTTGALTFDEACDQVTKIFGWLTESHVREYLRQSFDPSDNSESIEAKLLLASLRYSVKNRVKEGKLLTTSRDLQIAKVEVTKAEVSTLKGALDLYEFLNEHSPELSEPLKVVFKTYQEHRKNAHAAKLEKLDKEAEMYANHIQADSYEGISEFTPDTVEELLGDADKK